MSVSVVPDGRRGAGHALIRVGGAAGAASTLFRIARPAGWADPNLGPAGWQGAEAELHPLEASADGADLVLAVGPGVCGRMEEGTYLFALPAAGLAAVPVAWPEIEEVHGGTRGLFDEPRLALPAAPAVPAPAHPPPPVVAAPVPVPALGRKGSATAWVLLGVAALLLAGGGFWWRRHEAAPQPVEAPPAVVAAQPAPPALAPSPAPSPASPPAPAPPDLDSMSVGDLVGRNNLPDMLAQARKRLPAQPQDSLLLLEAAGDDRHDGEALTELARLYDPGRPRQGGIPADPRQAAKYYRAAIRANDESGKDDREALHRALLARRDAGDLAAKLIEQDFWP